MQRLYSLLLRQWIKLVQVSVSSRDLDPLQSKTPCLNLLQKLCPRLTKIMSAWTLLTLERSRDLQAQLF